MKKFYTIVGLTALMLYCLDRISKYLAVHFLEEPVIILKNHLQFEFYSNDNFLFYFDIPYQISTAVIVVVIFMVVYLAMKEYHTGHHFEVGLFILILAGAFSNLLDRINYGHVIDFINVPWWSVFNLADIYIVSGVTLMFVMMWKKDQEPSHLFAKNKKDR